jgi:four helix bundle protein
MSGPHFFKWLAHIKGEALATAIFTLSTKFPKEERYSLTDQIRRCSRSVTVNLAESYAKRCYRKHFYAKITDSRGENYETMGWLRHAPLCRYIDNDEFEKHYEAALEVEKLLAYMLRNLDKFRGEFANKDKPPH